MKSERFLNDLISLNVLASDINNAKEIYEATEGHVVIGLLSSNYRSVDEAVEQISAYDDVLDGAISIGLGGGDPKQSAMVAEICRNYKAEHVNQVFTAVGQTRTVVDNEDTWINALVNPTGNTDMVNIATGALSSQCERLETPIRTAIAMAREMGGNSLKFFPMNGLETIEQYKRTVSICAEEDFAIEPTGGLHLGNFKQIVTTALDAGVQKIIPHVYSSIIDKKTGKTNIDDVRALYEIMKGVG